MYDYQKEKPEVMTDDGQRLMLKIRDNIKKLIEAAGAARAEEAVAPFGGSDWLRHACLDRLVELGEIREVTNKDVMLQHRVFVARNRR